MSGEVLTFHEKAEVIIKERYYQTHGERQLLEAYLRGEVEEIWNLKALIDVRYERKRRMS